VDRRSTEHPSPQAPTWWQRGARGAALVEAALLVPILVLLTFGAIEYGLIYRDELRLTTAAREGARTGVADKDPLGFSVNNDDDYQVLQAVETALGPLASKVVYVSIYNAGTNPNGAPPSGCAGTAAVSQYNANGAQCDVWSYSDFSLSAHGVETSSKYVWLASYRQLTLNTTDGIEPTYLGVAIQTTHNYITGLFGSSRTISEGSVFRFEPVANVSHGNFLAPTSEPSSTTTTTTASTTTTTAGGGGGGGGSTTTTSHGTTTTSCGFCGSTTSTTWQGTTTTSHPTTTTSHPTTTTSQPTTTTGAPTTTAAPTTTSTTTNIVIIPT
jgi:hypothetical protein